MGEEISGGAKTCRSVSQNASPRRRRDAAATREAILEAATRRFATQGYERAGVREIAADAGVTAALVNRYFGSKEGLFAEVIQRALDMGHLLQGQRGDLADHLARVMVYGREDAPDGVLTPLLLLLHSAAEPGAIKLFRRDLDRTELRSSPSRSAATMPRSGPSWSWRSSRGSRSCITCSAPRRSRLPVARSWWPSCPGPSPLVSSEAPRVRLPFLICSAQSPTSLITDRRSRLVWLFIVADPVL